MNAKKFLEAETKNHAESHAYLLVGNRKTADLVLSYIIKTRGILEIDISTISPEEEKEPAHKGSKAGKAGEIKVEETRRLLREISRSPEGKQRLAVIYDCEKLNASSGNVLLKSLEEPAGPVVFVLIANTSAVLSTITSRCRVLNLDLVDSTDDSHIEEYVPILKKGFPEASSLIEKTVKEEKSHVLLQELTDNQRKKMLETKDPVCAKNLEEVGLARKRINQNGNQRLVLECLILKIGESL